MLKKQIGSINSCQCTTTRDKTNHTWKPINNTKDSIMSSCASGQMHHKIHADMVKTLCWVLQRLQQTTGFACTTFVLLAHWAVFTKLINTLKHILPKKTLLHTIKQLSASQMSTKGTGMQIMQYYLNSRTCAIWDDRTKMITHKLTQKSIPKLIWGVSWSTKGLQPFKPLIFTSWLLI